MQVFDFDVKILADLEAVYQEFWTLLSWPQIAPHVRRIDMHYDDGQVQVLTMTVDTKGRIDAFKSVRVRRGDTIFYVQPAPPPTLLSHEGSWRFTKTPDGTIVTSQHRIEVRLDRAGAFLEQTGARPASDAEIRERMMGIIRNNSQQTMLALKARIEAGKETNDEHQTVRGAA